MGTDSAPSYANIFMGKFEETFIYPFITNLHKLYLRYIDDIFIIWTANRQQFIDFIGKLNQKHPSIKFKHHISNKAVDFLDTTVYIDENNKLQTKLYRKPTDQQSYLHRNAEHPTNLKIYIPYSQALRIKRICSTIEEFDRSCDTLEEKFIQRGYSESEVVRQIKRAKDIPREGTLRSIPRAKSNRIPFVTKYNQTLPSIGEILHRDWNLLQLNPKL